MVIIDNDEMIDDYDNDKINHCKKVCNQTEGLFFFFL